MGLDVKIDPFDVEDQEDINERWTLWVDKLGRYFKHNKVEDDDMKINDFLMVAGDGIVKMYNSSGYKSIKKYDELVEKFVERFNPKRNKYINMFKFGQISQFEEEPFERFMTRLKDAAKIAKATDEQIIHQVVAGCRSKRLREKILNSDDVTLDKLMEYGQTDELVASQSREISGKRMNQVESEDEGEQPSIKKSHGVNNVQKDKDSMRVF
jgi:hypothetical protein